jgi:hypothetical protein
VALFRTTFFYEQRDNGWSESVHSLLTDPVSLIAQATGYVLVRMPLATPSTLLTHIRISDDAVFRDVILDPLVLPIPGTAPTAINESPWTAVDVRMSTSPLVQRSLFLRGLPDGQVNGSLPDFSPGFQASFNAWKSELLTDNWAIKQKDRSQVKQPILSVDGTGNVVMAVPLAGIAVKSVVQLLGVPRSKVPGRLFLIDVFTDASHFHVRGWPPGVTLTSTGFFRPVVYIVTGINQVVADAITERRVGRPFGLLRGRRAVVR